MNIFKTWLMILLLLLTWGIAQEEAEEAVPITNTGQYLILGEVGGGVGRPGYQVYNVHVSFQKNAFGVIFRGSWTGVGPYLSLAGRYYTPIPVPVPTFVSLGAGIYSDNPAIFATLGTHVPLGESNFRLTLEAGGSYGRQPVSDAWRFLPMLNLGVGYTFFIDQAPISEEERAQRQALREAQAAGCTEPTEPNYDDLDAAFDAKLERELAEAQVAYAGTYRLKSYSKRITDKKTDGNKVVWKGTFTAEVVEVLTGNVQKSSGSFRATFTWNGCGWGISYSID